MQKYDVTYINTNFNQIHQTTIEAESEQEARDKAWEDKIARFYNSVKVNPTKPERSEYFKERRKTRKSIAVYVDRDKAEKFESVLNYLGMSKTEWINLKIDELITEHEEIL